MKNNLKDRDKMETIKMTYWFNISWL
jgi:hypothetical protein